MNKIRQIGGIVLLIVLFSACTKEVSYYQEEIPEGVIVLQNGISQRVSENMILKIVNIEDSRCPVGSVCNTPGEVRVKFEVYADGVSNDFVVCYDQIKLCGQGEYKGHNIDILDVTPFPFAENPVIDQMDYRIEISVERE